MRIIWQGFGIMVFIIPFVLGAIFQLIFNNDNFVILGWILAGPILYFWGKKLHDKNTNIITLYDENGLTYEFKKHIDTFFWIPMEYWGFIWCGLAIFLLIGSFIES